MKRRSDTSWAILFHNFEGMLPKGTTQSDACRILDVSPVAVTRALDGGHSMLGTTKLRLALACGEELTLGLMLECIPESQAVWWERFLNSGRVPQRLTQDKAKWIYQTKRAELGISKSAFNRRLDVDPHFLPVEGAFTSKIAAQLFEIAGVCPSPRSVIDFLRTTNRESYRAALEWGEHFQSAPQAAIEEMIGGSGKRAERILSIRPGEGVLKAIEEQCMLAETSRQQLVERAVEEFISSPDAWEKVINKKPPNERDKITFRVRPEINKQASELAMRAGVSTHQVYVSALIHAYR